MPQPIIEGRCYFKILDDGTLDNIGNNRLTFPQSEAENINIFRRVILLSDDLNDNKNFSDDNWQNTKRVTSVVRWADFSGPHESRLTTILRKL